MEVSVFDDPQDLAGLGDGHNRHIATVTIKPGRARVK
jgi:hypothetical protein